MRLIKAAILNLFRNKKRTIFSIVGIAIGICSMLLVGGYYEYNYWGLRESCIRSQYGHIQISEKGYYEHKTEDPYAFLIEDYNEIISKIQDIKGIDVISPRNEFFALLETETGKNETVMIRGIIPRLENIFSTFFSKKVGRDLNDKDSGKAEVGIALMENAGLKIGDKCFINVLDSFGYQNTQDIVIKGGVASYSEEFDSRIVRLHLDDVCNLIGKNGVHEIAITVDDTKDTNYIANKIKNIISEYPNLTVTTWEDHASYYRSVVRFYDVYYKLVMLIVCIVVILLSFNIIAMGMNERNKEFGISKSLGATNKHLCKSLFVETLLISFFSLILGFLLAYGFSLIISAFGGIKIPPPPGTSSSIDVLIEWTLKNSVIAIVIGMVSPLMSFLVNFMIIKNKTVLEMLM